MKFIKQNSFLWYIKKFIYIYKNIDIHLIYNYNLCKIKFL